MTSVPATVLDRAGDGLGSFLPRLGGALALLVIGLLVVAVVARVVERALRGAGADDLGDRWGVHDVLARTGMPRPLSRLGRLVVRITLTLVVVFAALSLLGLQALDQTLNTAILFVPSVLVALALLVAGLVLAGLVRPRVDTFAHQLDLPLPLGAMAQVAVVAVFAVTAAGQLAISTELLLLLVTIVLAAVALTVALAFGLGGRELARALSAGRFVRGQYEVGQTISVGDVRGRIEAIDSAVTMVAVAGGSTVHLPNHLLLESVVTVDADES